MGEFLGAEDDDRNKRDHRHLAPSQIEHYELPSFDGTPLRPEKQGSRRLAQLLAGSFFFDSSGAVDGALAVSAV